MQFEEAGKTYRATKLNAVAQFHIVRRLAPVLGELAPVLQKSGGDSDGLDALPALTSAIGKLTDADADYILLGLLSCLSRKQEGGVGWTPITNTAVAGQPSMIMYDDIDMGTMLKLAWQAFQFNLADLFPALPSALSEATPKQRGRSLG